MADRTVKVKLKADVSSYVKDVAVATAATKQLRNEAERFEDKYTAVLDVKTRGAGGLQQAEQSMRRMSKASGDLQGNLAKLKKELRDLDGSGPSLRMRERDSIVREVAKVKSHLASLNNQRITIPIAAEITEGHVELGRLEQRLKRLDQAHITPDIDLRRDKLRKEIADTERDLRRLADHKLHLNPGEFATRLRRQVAAAAKSLPDIPLRADSSAVDREMAAIRAELMAMTQVSRRNVDAAAARVTQLQQRLRSLSSGSTTRTVRIDAGSAADELDKIERAGARASRTLDRVDASSRRTGRGMLHLVRQSADTTAALRQLSMTPIAVGLVPQMGSLIGSATQLGKVFALLPVAATSAAAGVGVIAAGVDGFIDAVKDGGEALDELSPKARKAAEELRSQSAEWRKVQQAIQDALFNGQAERLDKFGKVYLPIMGKAAGDLATELGNAAGQFIDFINSAESVRDTQNGLELTREAAERLGPTIVNLSTLWRDLSAVGARELPELALHFELMTKRWSDSISRARMNGDLQRWMREGQAEAAQMGRVLGDTGGILAGVGRASKAAGIDTVASLEDMTDSAHRWVDSWQGQAAIRSTMSGLRNDVNEFIPALRDLAGIAFDFVSHMSGSGTFAQVGQTFSALTESARPAAAVLGQMTTAVLKPLLSTIQFLAPALGPVIAGLFAMQTASKGLALVRGRIDGVAGRFDNAARAASGGERATSRVGGALRSLSGTLPVVGLALAGAAIAYDTLSDKQDQYASAVLNGSSTLKGAYDAQFEQMKLQARWLGLNGDAHVKYSDAVALTNGELQKQIDTAPPLEAANMRVTLAQQHLNEALRNHVSGSPPVLEAQAALTEANRQLEIEQLAAALGTDSHTAAIIRQRDTMLASQDAEFAYAQAKQRTTESIKTNGATLDWNTQQGLANQQALNGLRDAALKDIEAKRQHNVSTDEATLVAKAHQDQLFNTALQMGMSKDEAGKYVAELALIPPDKETRFFTTGLPEAITNVREFSRLLAGLQGNASNNMAGAVSDASAAVTARTGVPRRAGGGPIAGPGTGTSDSIMARLSDGEWVIKAATVDKLGDDKLAALNAGRADIVPKYATGGRVGSAPAGGVPRFNAGGAVTTAMRTGGSLGAALAAIQGFRTEVGKIWDGVVADTDRKWGTVESTVGTRMGNTSATGSTSAAGLLANVSGSFGQLPGATEGAFGAVQGTVGNRMLGTQQTASLEAGNLQRNVDGSWSLLAGNTDQRFTQTRDTATTRMMEGRDNASRTAGETDRNVTGAFGSMSGSSAQIFAGMMGNAAKKWFELRGAVNSPVHWVVNTAWNNGARALWDAAGKIFPLGPFPQANYATGGPVYGPGTGTSDSIPAMLSDQEHVWTAKEVAGAGGHGQVARLRAMAGAGQLAQFAQGGAWQGMWGQVKQRFPSARLTSHFRPGDPGYHGRGQAIDIAGPRSMDMPAMLAMNRWIASAMADKTELIHTQPGAVNLKNNRPHTYNAMTQRGHVNHVHWATGGGAQGPAGPFGFAVDMLASALEGPKNALRGMIGKAWPKNGTLSGDLPSHSGDWIIAKAEDVLRKKAEEMDAAMMAGLSGGGGGGRAGAERWRPLVLQALQMLGHPASLVERVLMQIGTESGGDPRAINNWDINAKRGTPSGGLLQTILPTYNAYADPRRNLGMFDPLSNILASMRYAVSRYGSLTAAYRGVGYTDGGVIPGASQGDDKLVLARAGERVLTTGQNIAFERLVDGLDSRAMTPVSALAGHVRGGDGASVTNNFHNENHFTEAVDLDLFNQRQDFAVRAVSF